MGNMMFAYRPYFIRLFADSNGRFSVSFDMVKNGYDHNGLVKLVQRTT